MKKTIIFTAGLFVAICAVFIATAPDKLSMAVVGVMAVAVALGYIFGIMPNLMYCAGFQKGRKQIDNINKLSVLNKWTAIRQIEHFFGQKDLDRFFDFYIKKTKEQQEEGMVLSDIEDVINEDSLAIRSWRGIVLQIAGILTALGLLGTFLGLITGISGVTFSTFEATVSSIEKLLAGIATAFYTSIVGVILSVIFNVVNRVVWNFTLREMNLFSEKFHAEIQPEAVEQIRSRRLYDSEQIIKLLSQINNTETRNAEFMGKDSTYEQRLMVQIVSGIKNGEIIPEYEPICVLDTHKVIKAACSPRWNHKTLGTIQPSVYLSLIRANGYITKLEMYLWNEVCRSLQQMKQNEMNTVPVVLFVSKVTLMSLDLEHYAGYLLETYDLSPRDLEWAISFEAYDTCRNETLRIEQELIQSGFTVSVDGFNGNFMELGETEADELILDMKVAEEDQLKYIFDYAAEKYLNVSAANIESAKQVVTLKKLGCISGRGEHLSKKMELADFSAIINGTGEQTDS